MVQLPIERVLSAGRCMRLRVSTLSHSTIVIDSGKSRINSNRFIIAETANARKGGRSFLVNSMYSRFYDSEESTY